MSRRWQAQSADGIMQEIPGVGIMSTWSTTTTPTNAANPAGYGAGCLWYYTPVSGPPRVFQNIGGNGYYVGATQNTTANWIESDPSSAGKRQFGVTSGSAYFNPSGTYYRTVLGQATTSTPAAIVPSATAAFKIVDAISIPANTLDLVGRTLRFSVFCNITSGSNEAQNIQVVAVPTNTGVAVGTAATWAPGASNATNAGVAGVTDGTITLTGGTAILDSGAVTYNAAALSGWLMQGELTFAAASKQESMVTQNITGATAQGVGAVTDRTLTTTVAIVFVVVVKTASTATNLAYCGMKVEVLN